MCGIEPQWKAYLCTKTDYLSCYLAFNVFFLTCHNTVCHTGLPCFLTPYDFTSSLRFDGEILSTLFLCCCLCVRKRNGSYKCVRLSVGFLLPISLSVILCGWLKGISYENLYRILRSVVPCAVSLRLPFSRSRLGWDWRGAPLLIFNSRPSLSSISVLSSVCQ